MDSQEWEAQKTILFIGVICIVINIIKAICTKNGTFGITSLFMPIAGIGFCGIIGMCIISFLMIFYSPSKVTEN